MLIFSPKCERQENIHHAYAIQSNTGTHYYDFDLNNYEPDKNRSRKELNNIHNFITKDLNKFKKTVNDYLTKGDAEW